MSIAEVRFGPERLERAFPDLHAPLRPQEAVIEAHRCLYCFDAPCTNACPTHIDVPRFIKKIATGNLRGSAMTILESNILGWSCSRVCPVDVLCEGACVLNRHNQKPIAIGLLQRRAMEHFHDSGVPLPMSTASKAKLVACVGSGPASLACAAEVRRHGYPVTIFEAREEPGGLNTRGVAEYKFRVSDSLREVEFIKSLGIEIRTGIKIGTDLPLEQLEQEFDAVFLGLGLGPIETLGIPGQDLPGVVDAVRFIATYKVSRRVPLGKRVVVVGGGNTAIDAAVAALKLGAEESTIVYRRGEEELPAFDFEYEHARAAGVRFLWQLQPLQIRGRGSIEGIECGRTRLSEPDVTGRRRPELVPGATVTVPCDTVVVALGQTKLTENLADRGIAFAGGRIQADPLTGQTANPKYFAAGDCSNGGREVVDAVAEGKRAGAGIARWLEELL